jgi:hypothetical protein
MSALITRYDRVLGLRTIALGAVLAVLVLLIVAVTDERESSWAARASRLVALLPLATGLACYLACEQARSRGEARVHASLGATSVQATRGSWLAGMLLGGLGAFALLSTRVDVRALFPRVEVSHQEWSYAGEGWFDRSQGILVQVDGSLRRIAAAVVVDAPPSAAPRGAAFVTVLVAAVAFPLWGSARDSAVRRIAVVLAVMSASITVFHLVAAGRVGPASMWIAPALLLADAWWLHRRGA